MKVSQKEEERWTKDTEGNNREKAKERYRKGQRDIDRKASFMYRG